VLPIIWRKNLACQTGLHDALIGNAWAFSLPSGSACYDGAIIVDKALPVLDFRQGVLHVMSQHKLPILSEVTSSSPALEPSPAISVTHVTSSFRRFVNFWFPAWKQVFPLYVAIQIGVLVISLYAPTLMLYRKPAMVIAKNSLSILWRTWFRYDSVLYLTIAGNGYTQSLKSAAFLPLYPTLIRVLTRLEPGHSSLIAALIISRIAGLVLLMVLYQLAREAWGEQVAQRAILSMVAFPTAFFLWAAYPEAVFLCLTVISFYAMYRNNWWLAGVMGLLSCLTRPNGIFLFLPFCFEYLRQRQFCWRAIRWNALSVALPIAGLGFFVLYCYIHYGDIFAFFHGQQAWKHTISLPGYGLIEEVQLALRQPNVLKAFLASSLNTLPDVLALLLIGLSIFGVCRLGNHHWTYVIYATQLWLFANSFPGDPPLLGIGRNILMIFPIFLMLAQLGRYRWFHLIYLSLAAPLCFFWLMQFITGYSIM
jgi:hypothetical protein